MNGLMRVVTNRAWESGLTTVITLTVNGKTNIKQHLMITVFNEPQPCPHAA